MPKTNKILTIVTNVGECEKFGFQTGLWIGELTHFWDIAEEAGFQLDIASPSGGYVPIDPESLAHAVFTMGGTDKRYQDRAFMARDPSCPGVVSPTRAAFGTRAARLGRLSSTGILENRPVLPQRGSGNRMEM